jgi:leukotriene-A4 hydrolase
MENPCIAFVPSSMIAGDKSLAYKIAHQLAHSWTGNLVTHANWTNYWLSQGLTVYLERKMLEILYKQDLALLSASIGFNQLFADTTVIGEDSTFTSLSPDIMRVCIV